MHWIAGIAELLAKILVGQKNKWGWIIHLISGALWTYIAIETRIYGLLIITIPATIINIYNFIKWHKN